MQDPPDTEPPAPPGDAAHTTADRGMTCKGCGYILEGLDLAGSCPECNTPILGPCFNCAYDLQHMDPRGNCPECGLPVIHSAGKCPLDNTSTDSLKTLHNGFVLALTGVALYLVHFIVFMIASGVVGTTTFQPNQSSPMGAIHTVNIISGLTSAAVSVVYLLGWWRISTIPDGLPGTLDRPDARKLLRVVVVVCAIFVVVSLPLTLVPPQSPGSMTVRPVDIAAMVIGVIALGAWLTLWIAQMLYIKWFARLAGNEKMHRRAKHFIWSGPLIFIVGLPLLLLGPIVFIILYYRMLTAIRRNIKEILSDRRLPEPQTP